MSTLRWVRRVTAGLILAAALTAGAAATSAHADPTPLPQPAPTAPATPPTPSAPATGTPTPTPAPGPSPTPPGPSSAPPPSSTQDDDPAWYDVPGQIRKGIENFFAWVVETTLPPVLKTMGETILATPDLVGNPRVEAVRTTFLMITNGCFILFVIFAGFVVTTRETLHTRYGVKELLPRLVIGFAAANLSGLICSMLISLANILTLAIVGQGASSIDSKGAGVALEQALTGGLITSPVPGVSGFLRSLLLLAALVMGLILVITWCLRLGMLLILVGIAPAALAFHAAPQTEGLAFAWWRSFIAVLGIQIGQAVVLLATIKVFLTPDGIVVNGIPATTSGLIGICMAISMLWLMVKIPGMMKQFVMGPLRGKGVIAQVIQTVAAIKTLGASAAVVTAAGAVKSTAKKAGAPKAAAGPKASTARLTARRASTARPAPKGETTPLFSHPDLPILAPPKATTAPPSRPIFSAPADLVPPRLRTAAPRSSAPAPAGSASIGFSHKAAPAAPWRGQYATTIIGHGEPVFSDYQAPHSAAPVTARKAPPAVFSQPAAVSQPAGKRPPSARAVPVFSDAPTPPAPKPPAPRTSRKKKS